MPSAYYERRAGVHFCSKMEVDFRDVRYRHRAKAAGCLQRFKDAFNADSFVARNMLMDFMLKRLKREKIDEIMSLARSRAEFPTSVEPASEQGLNEFPDHEQARRDRMERRYFAQKLKEVQGLVNQREQGLAMPEVLDREPPEDQRQIARRLQTRLKQLGHTMQERSVRLKREREERVDLECEAREIQDFRLEVQRKLMSPDVVDQDWSAEAEGILLERERAFERRLEARNARLRREYNERCQTEKSRIVVGKEDARAPHFKSFDSGDLIYDTMDAEEREFFDHENLWLFSDGLTRISAFLDESGEPLCDSMCEGEVESDYDDSTFLS
eukprot:766940-Hanusia_phi.AAC.2